MKRRGLPRRRKDRDGDDMVMADGWVSAQGPRLSLAQSRWLTTPTRKKLPHRRRKVEGTGRVGGVPTHLNRRREFNRARQSSKNSWLLPFHFTYLLYLRYLPRMVVPLIISDWYYCPWPATIARQCDTLRIFPPDRVRRVDTCPFTRLPMRTSLPNHR